MRHSNINRDYKLFKPNVPKSEADWDMIFKRLELEEKDRQLEANFDMAIDVIMERTEERIKQAINKI